MTIIASSTLDDIRSQLCDVVDLLTLATREAACDHPESTVVRLARRLADELVGTLDGHTPTTGKDDPWADLRDALANLADSGGDMTSLRVSFATRSLIVNWQTGAPTIDSFRTSMGEPQAAPAANLPTGPLDAECDPVALMRPQAG